MQASGHSSSETVVPSPKQPEADPRLLDPNPITEIVPTSRELGEVHVTWKKTFIRKGRAVLRILCTISGVKNADSAFSEDDGSEKSLDQYCNILEESVMSLMDKEGSKIPQPMRDSVTNLCKDLSRIAKAGDSESLEVDSLRWGISNRLQIFLLESSLAGYISPDVFEKIEGQMVDLQGKVKLDAMRLSIKSLIRARAAYNDYASENQRRVTCFEGTRQALLQEIGQWLAMSQSQIYVLSGLAGIGKSTIAQTVAKQADDMLLLGASFFFSRDEADRRTAEKFFTTLAFQLCVYDPEFAAAIERVLLTERGESATTKDPQEQLKVLILEPLHRLPPRPVVIVVDALDECDDGDGQAVVLALNELVQKLPSFKVILTTRPQPHLDRLITSLGSTKLFYLQNIEDKIVNDDIRLYLQHSLSRVSVEERLPDLSEAWSASPEEIDYLVGAAGRLFIIASTAVRFIFDTTVYDPVSQMEALKAAGRISLDGLDSFYVVILRRVVPEKCHIKLVERFKTVVGTIFFVQEPLPIPTLQYLAHPHSARDIDAVLKNLKSVITVEGETPRVYHTSFFDFLTDELQQRLGLHIAPVHQHTRLAICCFQIMNKRLKQNILGLGSPAQFLSNHRALEMQGISTERLFIEIPPELRYACIYWIHHVEGADIEDKNLKKELEVFANEHLLHWFEALSWIRKLDTAHRALLSAQKLLKSSCPGVHELATDGLRFVGQCYRLIQRSALHTYHSALPLAPTESILYKRYNGQMSVRVQGGPDKWDALLANVSHGEGANSIYFSLDNSTFSSCGLRMMKLWDTISGTPMKTITGQRLAISGDFSLAASSEGRTITLYDTTRTPPVATFQTTRGVLNLAFSSDGGRLAAGLADGTIGLWDSANGVLISTFSGWRKYSALVFSPNGTQFVFVSDDGRIEMRDGQRGNVIASLEPRSTGYYNLVFSGDGSRLACLGKDDDKGTLNLWNSENGTFLGTACKSGGIYLSMAISADGSLLATGGRGVKLWNGNGGNPLPIVENLRQESLRNTTVLAFSRDGILAATSLYTNLVTLYDIKAHSVLATLPFTTSPTALAFSPDCNRFAASSELSTVYLWDVASIKAANCSSRTEPAHHFAVLELSPDCSRLVSGFQDIIKLWDTENVGEPIRSFSGHHSRVTTLAFSPDSKQFTSGADDGTIKLWSSWDGEQVGVIDESIAGGVTHLALSSTTLAASTPDRILLWNSETLHLIDTIRDQRPGFLSFSQDGALLASYNQDSTVTVWDPRERKSMATINVNECTAQIKGLLTDGSILGAQEDISWLPALPRLYGVPAFPLRRDGQYRIEGVFPQCEGKQSVSLFHIPGNFVVENWAGRSSMLALGCSGGRILLLRFFD